MRTAKPGDVLLMTEGNWTDADILFAGQGSADRPITLKAEKPGKTILTGSSHLRIGGSYLVVDGLYFKDGSTRESVVAFRSNSKSFADHCRLTNTAIVNYNQADKKSASHWIGLYGNHNRMDHCYLAGKTNVGTTAVVWVSDTPNEHQIDHNHFGPRPRLGENGGETIRIGTSDVSMNNSRTLVESNYFEGCNGEIEIISIKSCENVIRSNTFVDCEGTLTLRHGNRNTVDGNFFLNEGKKKDTGGVRIIGEDHRVINNYFLDLSGDKGRSAISMENGIPNSPLHGYFQVKRAVVAFNTILHCRSDFAIGLATREAKTLPPTDCTIANNLVLCDGQSAVNVVTEPERLTWQGNIFVNDDPASRPKSGVRSADPRLAKSDDGLWRPQQGSEVIGAAEGSIPIVTEDIDGQPRGTRKDVGCDQVSDPPAKRRMARAGNTGPAWMEKR